MWSRRIFLRATAASIAAASWPYARHAWAAAPVPLRLQRSAGDDATRLPPDFTGLGFEMSSVARLGLLSVTNTPYVNLVRGLGPHGVLRFGGIVADYTRYQVDGQVRTEPKDTVVTRASLTQLRAFLEATQWSALWSLNFGRGSLEDAIVEARDVAHILGPCLLALELGNEVENYGKGSEPRRPAPYNYESFRTEYSRWHAALLDAVPGVHFAAPDTAASVTWVERMAADAQGTVQLLTTHYYRGDQHKGSAEQLLHPDPLLTDELQRLHTVSQTSGLPWRMCETNSFFGGGRPGVSDTLAGALWTLDYMLRLAAGGCAGVNMETGVNQLGFVSSYSPIQDDGAGHNVAGTPYYGMLAFAQAALHATEVLALQLAPEASDTLSAYLLARSGKPVSAVLIHRGARDPITVDLRCPALHAFDLRRARVLRLTGPDLEARTGVMLGGSAVDASGQWQPSSREGAGTTLVLQPASAAVLCAGA